MRFQSGMGDHLPGYMRLSRVLHRIHPTLSGAPEDDVHAAQTRGWPVRLLGGPFCYNNLLQQIHGRRVQLLGASRSGLRRLRIPTILALPYPSLFSAGPQRGATADTDFFRAADACGEDLWYICQLHLFRRRGAWGRLAKQWHACMYSI